MAGKEIKEGGWGQWGETVETHHVHSPTCGQSYGWLGRGYREGVLCDYHCLSVQYTQDKG